MIGCNLARYRLTAAILALGLLAPVVSRAAAVRPAARPLTWATEWRDLDAFEEWLVARLTAPRAVAGR